MKFDFLTRTDGMDQKKPGVLFASFQRLLDASTDMVFVKDINLTYVAGTRSFAEMAGKTSMTEVLGRTDFEIFADKELAGRYTADDRKLLEGGKDLLDYLEPLTDENGEARYSSTSKYILRDDAGNAVGILGISRDITGSIKAYQQYQQAVEYLFTLPEDTFAAVLIDVNDWRIIAQRRQESIYQFMPMFDSMETLLTVARDNVCDVTCEAFGIYRQLSPEYLSGLYAQGKSGFEVEYERCSSDNGATRWVRDEWRFLADPRNGHLTVMVLVKDIHTDKKAKAELEHAAKTDEMTGLLNRAATRAQIREYLSGEGANGVHAIYMIDLDDFKQVNDTYGHQAGDRLLIELGRGIKKCFRGSDIVGRIGGDEFFVLAKNMPGDDAVRNRADYLLAVMRAVYSTQTTAMGSVSVGISFYPEDGKDLDALYEKADKALYKAKNAGKNRYAFSSEEHSKWNAAALAKRYEAYNSQVVDHSGSPCYISDLETYDLLHLTKGGMALYGMTRPEEYLGRKCYKVIMGLDEPCPFCTNSKLSEGMEYRWEHYNDNIDRWFDRTSSIIHLDGRRCHLEIGRDITARKNEISLLSGKLSMEDVLFRCLQTLTREKDLDTALNLFLEAVGGYYQSDRAYILEIDWSVRAARCTFEWHSQTCPPMKEAMQGVPMDWIPGWYEKFAATGEHTVSDMATETGINEFLRDNMAAAGVKSALMVPLRRDGGIVGILGVDNPRKQSGNLVLLRSVAEFVQAELEQRRLISELEYLSFTDTLTGLKNRHQFLRVLKAYDFNIPETMGFVVVDINGLKVINDTHSQSFGDHVIRRVGQLVTENSSGNVFRIGGGEFVAICENIEREAFQQQVVTLRSAFDGDKDYSVSIGCAWSEEAEDVNTLMKQAEELLHADKRSYYHTVLREGRSAASPGSFTNEVLREVNEGRFVVHYQPQVDIQTGKIIGAEALVRKVAEDGRLIPPNKFIPFYEMEGVVGLVDMFVLDTACATMRKWLEQGYQLHLSVNFSRVTLLEPEIVSEMGRVCQRHGVSASAITIEVTESISKMDQEQLKELIQTINAAGFTVSLDDFGSQYSNLAILSALDFDEIKFDRSLVKALEHNRKSRIVMENSVRLCHDLDGTSSLAEGIETKGQLELLQNYKCDYGQGYYFSKPLPENEFALLLGQNTKER